MQIPADEATSPEVGAPATSEGGSHGGGERRGRPRPPAVRYLGFRTTADGREYSLLVTDGLAPRLFVLLIPHEVFASREARFQDAPDLCFAKLRRDLVENPDLLPGARLVLTTKELSEYRNARENGSPNRKGRRTSAG